MSESDTEMFEGGNDEFLNWDTIPEASFEPLAGGTYNATITKAEHKLSQNSGKPMWSLELTVTDEGEGIQNRKIFDNISFSEKALPYTKKTLSGLCPELLGSQFSPRASVEQLLGRQVKVTVAVKSEVYEGESRRRNVVKKYAAPGDAFLNG